MYKFILSRREGVVQETGRMARRRHVQSRGRKTSAEAIGQGKVRLKI